MVTIFFVETLSKHGFDYLSAFSAASEYGTNEIHYPTHSGRSAIVRASGIVVMVKSVLSHMVTLNAWVNNGMLFPFVYTRDYDGNLYDEDFYSGSLFYDSFMQWFRKCGTEITSIRGQWSCGSCNTNTLIKLTSQGIALEEAIAYTWSAKQAAKNGYMNYEILEQNGPLESDGLSVTFTKP